MLEDLGEDSCKTLGEDLQGFVRLWDRVFARICETLEEDSQGYTRICKDS